MSAARSSIVKTDRFNTMVLPRFTFREWLIEHKEQFVTFTLKEIADVALMSGYTPEEIESWFRIKEKYHV